MAAWPLHLTLAVCCVLAFCCAGYAQSTFGTVLGTVKDPSGSVIPRAAVTSDEQRHERGAYDDHQYERCV